MVHSASGHRSSDPAGRRRVALLSAVLVIAGVAAGLAWLWRERSAEPVALKRLADAVGAHRVTRARLSGGFEYAPCPEASPEPLVRGLLCDGPQPADWPDAPALHALAREVRSEINAGAPREHHFIGAWKVIWGDLDAAVTELREAARLEPANAAVQNDLAVALLALAESRQNPRVLTEAFVAADSAVILDSRSPEARFNRALALEQLHLRADAIEAWRGYLAVDRRSAWADEARRHLTLLTAERPRWSEALPRVEEALASDDRDGLRLVASQFPLRVRNHVRALLDRWAERHAAGMDAPDALLTQAARLAGVLQDITGDATWADPVRELEAMHARQDDAHVAAIAAGLVGLAHGERLYEEFALDSAELWLGRARRAFVGRSRFAHWVTFDVAKIAYQRHDYAGALRRLRDVLDSTPASWLQLRGLALRTIGFVEHIQTNRDAAVVAYASAMNPGDALGEPVLDLRTRVDAARLALELRGQTAAWMYLYQAFRALGRYAETPPYAQHVYATAAELSSGASPRLALLYQRESVRRTTADRQPGPMVLALTREARLLTRVGRPADAIAALRQTESHLGAIGNDSIEAEMRADATLVAAEAWLRLRPDSARDLLEEVVERYRDTRYFVQLGHAQVLLANALAASGAVDAARSAFEESITETERQRAEISQPEYRAQFLDQARPVIDSVLRFLVRQGDTVDALDFFERMRSRVLLEQVRGAEAAPATHESVAQWRERLPQGTAVIVFAVLADELITWLVGHDDVRMRRTPLDTELDGLTERFATLVANPTGEDELRDIAARLHQLLVAPIQQDIAPATRLVFVPDQWLHRVPFAALFDPNTSRFLVQDHAVSVSPSVQLYLEAAERYRRLQQVAAPSVLAIGDPAFDARTHGLASLPAARREAERVAAQYSRAVLLSGASATPRAFLRAAPAAGIIHFAGHGVVREDAPLSSHLLLAADTASASTGALYASDIFALRLPRTRLAILSGCHTAGGRVSYTEGTSSLARAFFAAGVPAVVASLWAVADDATAEFFAAFHEELARGTDPTAALRAAQLRWLSRPQARWSTLSTWAAFQLFGGTDELGNVTATTKS